MQVHVRTSWDSTRLPQSARRGRVVLGQMGSGHFHNNMKVTRPLAAAEPRSCSKSWDMQGISTCTNEQTHDPFQVSKRAHNQDTGTSPSVQSLDQCDRHVQLRLGRQQTTLAAGRQFARRRPMCLGSSHCDGVGLSPCLCHTPPKKKFEIQINFRSKNEKNGVGLVRTCGRDFA